MVNNISDIVTRLASENKDKRGEVVAFPARVRKKRATSKQLAHIEEILLQLLNHEESGTVRIAAAKVLLERMNFATKENDEAKKREAEEGTLALADAQNILAEFAAAKLAGVSLQAEVVADGAAPSADAAASNEGEKDRH